MVIVGWKKAFEPGLSGSKPRPASPHPAEARSHKAGCMQTHLEARALSLEPRSAWQHCFTFLGLKKNKTKQEFLLWRSG